jgi:hypothetical protein
MRLGEDQWVWMRIMQQGGSFIFSTMPLVCYSRTATNRSASIYRREQTEHSIAELYDASQSELLNEYVARVGLGKAITQSVRGGTEDARQAIKVFSYTKRNGRQLRRLKMLNSLPRSLRPLFDGVYGAMAWIVKRRGL